MASLFTVGGQDLDDRYAPIDEVTPANYIGVPGTVGFGVGWCPVGDLPSGMVPMTGCKNPRHENYGNYKDRQNSQMVYIPAFYWRAYNLPAAGTQPVRMDGSLANTADPLLAGRAGGIEITQNPAQGEGWVIDRAFLIPTNHAAHVLEGTPEAVVHIAKGIFVDKCQCTYNGTGPTFFASPGSVVCTGQTIADNSPGSLNSWLYQGSESSNIYFSLGKAVYEGRTNAGISEYGTIRPTHLMPLWVWGMLVRLAMCQAKHSPKDNAIDPSICAWNCFPYTPGGNISNLSDNSRTWITTAGTLVNGGSLSFAESGVPTYGVAGQCDQGTEYISHNGQKCGVLDLVGRYWEYVGGAVVNGGDLHVLYNHNSNWTLSATISGEVTFATGNRVSLLNTKIHAFYYRNFPAFTEYVSGDPQQAGYTGVEYTAAACLMNWNITILGTSETESGTMFDHHVIDTSAPVSGDAILIPGNTTAPADGVITVGGGALASGASDTNNTDMASINMGMFSMCVWPSGSSATITPAPLVNSTNWRKIAARGCRYPLNPAIPNWDMAATHPLSPTTP
jgi:hypothetical protein